MFDAASVKPSSLEIADLGRGRKGPPPFTIDPKRLAARGLSLKRLISQAHGFDISLVSGGAAWTENERYDIDAITESPANREEMLVMLRNALADRFQLKFHTEKKAVPRHVLAVARNGPKFGPHFHLAQAPAALARPTGTPDGKIRLNAKTMKDLAYFLSDNRRIWDDVEAGDGASLPIAPVVDQTGLTSVYDIVLSFVSRRDWLAVFEQELGLKVEIRKIPSEIFVIESANRPTPN